MNKNFRKNNQGIAAIEFAIIFPLLLILLLGMIDFGMYFVKNQIAARAVATLSDSVQKNANDPELYNLAQNSGLSFLDLNAAPNYICTQAYETLAQAQNNTCGLGDWDTTRPNNVEEGAPYYVAVVSYVQNQSITGLTALTDNFLPDIIETQIVQVNVSTSPIIGAKLKSYTPTFSQALDPSSWQQGDGLNITYTPKSDDSKIKISFAFHAVTNHAYLFSYRLIRDGTPVPGKAGILGYSSYEGASVRQSIQFTLDSWGKDVSSTLSLDLKASNSVHIASIHIAPNFANTGTAIYPDANISIIEVSN